jgi:hypothetical protein
MAQSFELSAEDLAERLTKSFQVEIKMAIEAELTKMAMPIIRNIAEQMAKNIKGNIRSRKDPLSGDVQVMIWIDGVEQKKENPT